MGDFLYFGNDLTAYSEIPVDIDTFITDPYFMGNYCDNKLFPFWKDQLEKVFSDNFNCACVITATAIGAGKTVFSFIALAYKLYLFMCLKNPTEFFKFTNQDKLTFLICDDVGNMLQRFTTNLSLSGWFRQHGVFTDDGGNLKYTPVGDIEIISSLNLLGRNVVSYYFYWTHDKITNGGSATLNNSLLGRIVSRTIIDNKKYGTGFIDIEPNCAERIYDIWVKDTDCYYIITGAQYEIKPSNIYSKKQFIIATDGIVGHSHMVDLTPESLRDIEDGYKLILIPEDFRYLAKIDCDTVIRDICGIRLKKS